MAEATNELVVEILRKIQVDVSDLKTDVRELRTRFGHLEVQMASLSSRMDRRDETMDRVMRRLELLDEHHAPSP